MNNFDLSDCTIVMDASSKTRRLMRRTKLNSKRYNGTASESVSFSPDTITGAVTVIKDRKAKNRESAMLSRMRKNLKMKALEEENAQLRQENMQLRRTLYRRDDTPNVMETESGSVSGSWVLDASNRKPEVFTVL